MATIYPKPGNTAQLCSALPRIQAGVWVVSGPRRHQEAAGIHGEAAQDSAVGLFNFDIRIVLNTHYQIFEEGVVLRLFSALHRFSLGFTV